MLTHDNRTNIHTLFTMFTPDNRTNIHCLLCLHQTTERTYTVYYVYTQYTHSTRRFHNGHKCFRKSLCRRLKLYFGRIHFTYKHKPSTLGIPKTILSLKDIKYKRSTKIYNNQLPKAHLAQTCQQKNNNIALSSRNNNTNLPEPLNRNTSTYTNNHKYLHDLHK